MAKPAHTRVTFEGVIGTVAAPIERWAFSVNFPHDVLPANGIASVDDATAASLKGAYATHLAPEMPVDTILTQVKVSRVGADGHVEKRADGSYVQGVWIGSVAGVAGANAIPLQTALCVSLKTLRAGATGKGRYFLPFPSYPIVTSDKRISSTAATQAATKNKDFLNALSTVTTFAPQVVSSKGYMTEITGLRVGRVPDTMRSRREDVVEGYVDVPLH